MRKSSHMKEIYNKIRNGFYKVHDNNGCMIERPYGLYDKCWKVFGRGKAIKIFDRIIDENR